MRLTTGHIFLLISTRHSAPFSDKPGNSVKQALGVLTLKMVTQLTNFQLTAA